MDSQPLIDDLRPADVSPLTTELREGETLLWSAQPDATKLFDISDAVMIPFSLMWGGFAFFWETAVVVARRSSSHPVPFFFVLWGIPFVLSGLYLIIGRFFVRVWTRKRTWYGVTSQRVLIVRTGFQRTVMSLTLGDLPALTKRGGGGGPGTLYFGVVPIAILATMPMTRRGRRIAPAIPAFEHIPDVDAVERLIHDLQAGAR